MSALLKLKSQNSEDLPELRAKVQRIEKEMKRLESMEKSLAYHETVLTKKVSDMYRIETQMEDLVHQREMAWVREELKKFDKHEDLLFENAKFIREIVNELGKVKEAHRLSQMKMLSTKHVEKDDCEEKHGELKSALEEFDKIKKTHNSKVSKDELLSIKNGLQEKMGQLEYQNKLLMKYLKKVDEHVVKRR